MQGNHQGALRMAHEASAHPPKSFFRTLISSLFLVALVCAALIYDHYIIEGIREFLRSGRMDFVSARRLVAYLITTLVFAKLIHKKYPVWMITCASALSFLLVALLLQ
jgi:hypothetical protein